jgi:hypothetical protein
LQDFWKEPEEESTKPDGLYRKTVTFGFREARQKPGTANNCCLVNFIRGHWRSGDEFVSVPILGERTEVNFDDWEFDSVDDDSVWLALSGREYRQLYRHGWAYFSLPDRAGPFRQHQEADLGFSTCIYDCNDIPETGVGLDASSFMQRNKECIKWNVRFPK